MSEPSMEDTIRDAIKGTAFADSSETLEAEAEPAVESEPVIEDKPQVGRPRDESGKFAKAEPVAEQPKEVTTEAKPPRRAPNTWKKEAAAKWDTLPPDLQDEIERRENDIRSGIESYRTKAQMADAFDQALAPYKATLNGFGIPAHEAVGRLLATEHSLRYGNTQQKATAFKQLAADYGVDVSGLTTETAPIDPNLAALQQEIGQLRTHLTQREQVAQQEEATRITSVITDFGKSHPHLETVREDMAALLQSGRAKDLEEAYEKAIWASPDLRQSLLAEQQEKERKEVTRKTEEARKAAAVNVPVKGTLAGMPPKGTMDEDIRAGARRLGLIN